MPQCVDAALPHTALVTPQCVDAALPDAALPHTAPAVPQGEGAARSEAAEKCCIEFCPCEAGPPAPVAPPAVSKDDSAVSAALSAAVRANLPPVTAAEPAGRLSDVYSSHNQRQAALGVWLN